MCSPLIVLVIIKCYHRPVFAQQRFRHLFKFANFIHFIIHVCLHIENLYFLLDNISSNMSYGAHRTIAHKVRVLHLTGFNVRSAALRESSFIPRHRDSKFDFLREPALRTIYTVSCTQHWKIGQLWLGNTHIILYHIHLFTHIHILINSVMR